MSEEKLSYLRPSDSSGNDVVEQLQTKLLDYELQTKALRDEIETLLHSLEPGPSGAFSVLPTELLIKIFTAVLVDNPMHNGRLMQVCRSWNQIIKNTTQFWAKVRIIVPRELQRVKQCAKYSAICVARSGSLPLDIKIQYTKFQVWPQYCWDMVAGSAAKEYTPSWWHVPYVKDLLSERYYYSSANPDYFSKYHREAYLAIIRTFSGAEFSVMRRWRSFEVKCDELGYDGSLLLRALYENALGGGTPLLERITLRATAEPRSYMDSIAGPIPQIRRAWEPKALTTELFRPLAFPDLPRLQQLMLYHISMPLDLPAMDPRQITHLSLHCYDWDQIYFIYQCQT